jgi:hypothetical protein
MDENPGQFMLEVKFAIIRGRVGPIALAVVLAEESIPFLSALVWNLPDAARSKQVGRPHRIGVAAEPTRTVDGCNVRIHHGAGFRVLGQSLGRWSKSLVPRQLSAPEAPKPELLPSVNKIKALASARA